MIDTEVKVHDNFSLEFKIGFITNKNGKDINEFRINTWVFVPNSLDINRSTYKKNDFYRDVKTNMRLITPVYSLEEILKAGRGPLPRLQKALDALVIDPADEVKTESFVYQVKMLVCIVKSALRRHVQIIKATTTDEKTLEHVEAYIRDIREINLRYRELWDELSKPDITKQQREYFLFGDDFLGNITEQYTFQVIRLLRTSTLFEAVRPKLHKLIEDEIAHRKKRGFMLLDKDNEKHNSLVITQRNILKKFVESDLFLQIIKKKDGFFAEQFYYSIAAGVAMIFATVISFFATQRFGNFTTDLFIILVFSYMFKDRIKDMMRYYFSSKLGKKYFDTKLKLSIRKQEIGWIKEAFDYIEENKLSEEVRNIRARSPLVEAENQVYDEKIMLYRKWVNLSKEEIEKYKEYRLSGVNDITRINLLNFTQKMDNPHIPLYISNEERGYISIEGNKMYSLYFILHCKSDEDEYYKKYRVMFNRNGISDVTELN
ncbi:hypothetical protein M2451_003300 [Dysgonomonas sp. PFB1-18]|uniref:hypothetical protein n=1 Tax=unclassified Dysgonomonas TaxID=2630389 RepID=UPI002475C2AA|nr:MULTISPECIES: hypothetical protein [unclassified Dysgonomonas]MDH6310414.1 hypothetical protein [Dysgonomonas sp. PF1-14]MDH6340256.1 hypothetical protein [Dysgonomonas sp. PF1-16]MDH6381963.1 hypothetical protein [Dysgonomonas sp. PFB1-18]MDH6399228.1 hypothetical protein [Dysgonomonas sp. PF1-23]